MFKTKKAKSEAEPTGRSFTSSEISEMTGVSLRQLQWWDEQKVVSPRHEGHKRIYLAEEAVEIAVIAELRRKGFSLQKIRQVLRFLQKEMGKKLAEIFSAESDWHLLTDGKSIYLEDNNERIINLFKDSEQPMFLVCVTDQARRLGVTVPGAARKPVRPEISANVKKARAV
jgi:DNA-binding transcriptional MerR regulator